MNERTTHLQYPFKLKVSVSRSTSLNRKLGRSYCIRGYVQWMQSPVWERWCRIRSQFTLPRLQRVDRRERADRYRVNIHKSIIENFKLLTSKDEQDNAMTGSVCRSSTTSLGTPILLYLIQAGATKPATDNAQKERMKPIIKPP